MIIILGASSLHVNLQTLRATEPNNRRIWKARSHGTPYSCNLVLKLSAINAFTAAPGASGVATLYHEILDDAMELQWSVCTHANMLVAPRFLVVMQTVHMCSYESPFQHAEQYSIITQLTGQIHLHASRNLTHPIHHFLHLSSNFWNEGINCCIYYLNKGYHH